MAWLLKFGVSVRRRPNEDDAARECEYRTEFYQRHKPPVCRLRAAICYARLSSRQASRTEDAATNQDIRRTSKGASRAPLACARKIPTLLIECEATRSSS